MGFGFFSFKFNGLRHEIRRRSLVPRACAAGRPRYLPGAFPDFLKHPLHNSSHGIIHCRKTKAWFCLAPGCDGLRRRIRRRVHVPQGSPFLRLRPGPRREARAAHPGCARVGEREERSSQPVSRVLSRAIIHLRPASPRTCSGLPESGASSAMGFLFGLAPGGVCLAADCCQPRGALLPHHFTLARQQSGGMLSVALAVGSRPPGVTWRPALRSPDFPPPAPEDANSDCPADSISQINEVARP